MSEGKSSQHNEIYHSTATAGDLVFLAVVSVGAHHLVLGEQVAMETLLHVHLTKPGDWQNVAATHLN